MKFLLSTLICISVFGADIFDTYKEVEKHLIALKKCSLSDFWEGYTWNQLDQFYFVSKKNKTTFLFDYKQQIRIPFRYEDTPVFALSTFGRSELDSVESVAYSLDYLDMVSNNSDKILRLALHENFHFYGQGKIHQNHKFEIKRGIYPFKIKPRTYRAMIIYNLKSAIQNVDLANVYLSRANYWDMLHKKEFPTDHKSASSYDLIEGSAKYAEIMSLIFLHSDCRFAQSKFDSMFFIEDKGETHILDEVYFTDGSVSAQSYYGGMLPYFVDNIVFGGKIGVMKDSNKGIPPMESLFKNFKSEKETVRADISKSISSYVNSKNIEAEKDLSTYAEAINQGKTAISINTKTLQDTGAFGVHGFINVSDDSYPFWRLLKHYSGKIISPAFDASLRGINLFETRENVCGAHQYVLWIDKKVDKSKPSFTHTEEAIEMNVFQFTVNDGFICI